MALRCLSFGVLVLAILYGAFVVILPNVGVRSVALQTLHYFSRPHERIILSPLNVPAAWNGREMEQREDLWRESLTPEHIEEIEHALNVAARTCGLDISRKNDTPAKKTSQLMMTLSKEDFPLGPAMSEAIARWRQKVSVDNVGVRVIRGVPTHEWPIQKSELFFWCIGLHLGTTGAQNDDGELLGHVRDIGGDHDKERQFKTNGPIAFHCDAADVVGLLALSTAKSGGASRLVSSVTVYNTLLAERPDLIPILYEPVPLDVRRGDGVEYVTVPPVRYASGVLRTFWHEAYFQSVYSLKGAPRQDAKVKEAQEAYNEVLNREELWLKMELEVGDIQLCSNHVVLHSRDAFEDYPREEDEQLGVDRRRHLLRLWLSTETPADLWNRLLVEVSRASLVVTVLLGKAHVLWVHMTM